MKNLLFSFVAFLIVFVGRTQDAAKNPRANDDPGKIKAYVERNRTAVRAMLNLQRSKWNKTAGYLVRSKGDTIRPYTQSDWMRDSLYLETRNWDDPNATWPETFAKGPVYHLGKNYKMDSANSNRAGRTTDTKLAEIPGQSQSLAKDTEARHTGEDYLFMRDGSLMVSQSEVESVVLGYIVLPDGTLVFADGSLLLNNGTSMQLKEGERINLFDKSFRVIRQ